MRAGKALRKAVDVSQPYRPPLSVTGMKNEKVKLPS
jgi:hypothetical protein